MDGGSTGGNGRKRSHEDKAEAVREMAKGFRLRAAHGESYLHCSKKVNRAHSTCPPPIPCSHHSVTGMGTKHATPETGK